MNVFTLVLSVSAAMLSILWWVQRRQNRQISGLMARLQLLEAEAQKSDRPFVISDVIDGVEAKEADEDRPPDDVLAGYTSHIQLVVSRPNEGPSRLSDQAILKIHQNLEDGYRPAQLAEDLCISLRTLERGLAEVFDCTPNQLITAMKMREARRLLETGDFRVNEVASRLGFSSPFYFSRRFRTFFGVSPSQYRQAAEGGG